MKPNRPQWWRRRLKRPGAQPAAGGLYYAKEFVSPAERAEVLRWLQTLHPLWEYRFSTKRPVPEGKAQRRLLRPVYWLGNWQFACLDYYRPPKGVEDRCVRAEPFPPVLATWVARIDRIVRHSFSGNDVPKGWHLNTCLVNLYGRQRDGDRWIDTARVGEHKDFEPGPVASVSLGERALFQFVESRRAGEREGVVAQQWLDDGSLQIFGGDRWKKQLFHRVQRVDRREGHRFEVRPPDVETRRVNFTFRYVPPRHVKPFAQLSPQARADVEEYVRALAEHSEHFARELALASS